MNIVVSGRNFAVTDALREHVESKIGSAVESFDIPADVEVVLRVGRNPSNPVPQVVEVTVYVKGAVIRVSEAEANMYAAIDKASDRVSRQMRKYKTRVVDRRQRGAGGEALPEAGEQQPAGAVAEPVPAEEEPEEADEILREKLIEFTVLTEDQALFHTDLLGHDFYVFTNADTGDVNVIYRRKDGGYGILKPIAPAPAMGK